MVSFNQPEAAAPTVPIAPTAPTAPRLQLLAQGELAALHGLSAGGFAHVGAVPESAYAPMIAQLLLSAEAARQASKPPPPDSAPPTVLYVLPDRQAAEVAARQLRFWSSALRVMVLPAWDCEPYDRSSPSARVMSRRMFTLARLLAAGADKPQVVVTTSSALSQRVLPARWLRQATLTLRAGGRVAMERVREFLARHGYQRVQRVMEPGDYAVRGGLLDVFAPGRANPLRCDFFGDELESIKRFNTEDQRSDKSFAAATLLPARELMFAAEHCHNYLNAFHRAYGVMAGADPIYRAVKEQRAVSGLEHWLPWLCAAGEMSTVLDYLPADAFVVYDIAALTAISQFHERAEQALSARLAALEAHRRSPTKAARLAHHEDEYSEPPYFPVPASDGLYIGEERLRRQLAQLRCIEVSAIASAPSEAGQMAAQQAGAGISICPQVSPSRNFVRERRVAETNLFSALDDYLRARIRSDQPTIISSTSLSGANRLRRILADRELATPEPVTNLSALSALPLVSVAVLEVDAGFCCEAAELLSEGDILGQQRRSRSSGKAARQVLQEFSTLSVGDYLVHTEHGIGRFSGMSAIVVGEATHDCVAMEYFGGDKLYVPVASLDLVSRYGSSDKEVALDRLGAKSWQLRKAKLKRRLRDMTKQLMAVAAQRNACTGAALPTPIGQYDEFCARFPYLETRDQGRAISDVLADLARDRPMDRLVCGDVGFGKTEVAIRAAFVAANNAVQTAVIAPTTLLARQHLALFRQRFAGLEVNVVGLSRLLSARHASEARHAIAAGNADIAIGTHALLAKSVTFPNLGLLIIDEEQRFGVAHKERLKQLRASINVLTLSATPIPRTMQLAMTGIRELSLITTPPWDRMAVQTTIGAYDSLTLQTALRREKQRDGQSFVICPRVSDLAHCELRLRDLVPEMSIAVVHGRLPPARVEETMSAFCDGHFDILLATPIVESGLDIPNANTMIIERADRFGLAQLYQLRGRVGRSRKQSYAVINVPDLGRITPAAARRLQVLGSLNSLGAGFTLASHDLDARGAGNLLGEEQSGHVREVGVELYQQMLEEAAAAVDGDDSASTAARHWSPQINLGLSALLPDDYVADFDVRLALYRRIAQLSEDSQVEDFADELRDRFGKLPAATGDLLQLIRVKILCRRANVDKVDADGKVIAVRLRGNKFPAAEALARLIAQSNGRLVARPDGTITSLHDGSSSPERVTAAMALLTTMAQLAASQHT